MIGQIITRGYGSNSVIIARGYGAASGAPSSYMSPRRTSWDAESVTTSLHNKDTTWLEAQDITTIEEA